MAGVGERNSMRQLSLRLGIALFTFVLAVTLSSLVSKVFKTPQAQVSTNISTEDQWHRLYEAAGMSGDSTLVQSVHKRLLCANKQGIADAIYIETNEGTCCQKMDKTNHQLYLSEYGEFHRRIRESHHAWTLANLDFVRSVSSKKKARDYLASVEGLVFVTINETKLVSDSITIR
jgi:hypothetical protein